MQRQWVAGRYSVRVATPTMRASWDLRCMHLRQVRAVISSGFCQCILVYDIVRSHMPRMVPRSMTPAKPLFMH